MSLTQGVVVQIENSDLGAVGHSDGQAAPALGGDTRIGAQCQLFQAWAAAQQEARAGRVRAYSSPSPPCASGTLSMTGSHPTSPTELQSF